MENINVCEMLDISPEQHCSLMTWSRDALLLLGLCTAIPSHALSHKVGQSRWRI